MAARCGECGKMLPFEYSNPSDLMMHAQMCHPGITAVRYDLAGEEAGDGGVILDEHGIIMDEHGELVEEEDEGGSASTCDCSSGGEFKIVSGDQKPKIKIYRVKIDAWRPGLGYMYCPFCKDKTNPLIQQNKTEKSVGTMTTTFWMFACWPLCFLPLLSSHQPIYLYCSKCREFLGAYDRENMRVKLRRKKCEPCPKKAKRVKNHTC